MTRTVMMQSHSQYCRREVVVAWATHAHRDILANGAVRSRH